jgi:hypothetical protein
MRRVMKSYKDLGKAENIIRFETELTKGAFSNADAWRAALNKDPTISACGVALSSRRNF